jgi:hypothetical protein
MAAQGPLPPGLFGYRDDGPAAFNPVVYRKVDGRLERRSIEEAKKLLAEAGYPNGRDEKTGRPLVLNFDYLSALTPAARSLMDWYQKQFAKIGVQLEIRATDYNRFQDKVNKGSHQIYFWGWLADYPDAENFLFLLYGPNAKSLTNGNGENASNYRNAEFDRRFEQMKFEEDGPAKAKLIDEMIRIAQEDAVWSWGYFPTSAAAFHQWVYNGKPTQIIRNHIQYLRVDPQLRAQKIAEWNRPIWWPVALIVLAWSPRWCRRSVPTGGANARTPRARWRARRTRGRRSEGPRCRRRGCHSRASGNPVSLPAHATLGPRFRGDDTPEAADAELHPPPHRLRRADPGRGQPVHLRPVLRRQHARRHGAAEHRRQAGDAGGDREVEGRARLRQAAALQRREGGAAA